MNVIYQDNSDNFINFWMLNNPLSIPQEVIQYHPPESRQFSTNKTNVMIRRIFEGQDSFNNRELTIFGEFLDIADDFDQMDNNISFIKSDIIRFIYYANFNASLAFKQSIESTTFLKSIFPINLTHDIKKIFETKMIYTFGRDINYNPILIINCQKILEEKAKNDNLQLSIIFIIDYIVKYMLLPGQIENIDIIIQEKETDDLEIKKNEESIIIFLLDLIVKNYPIRVDIVFFKNTNTELMNNIFSKINTRGIEFLPYKSMQSLIHPEQREAKFEGTADSLDNNINFIPFNASKNFKVEEMPKKRNVTKVEDENPKQVNQSFNKYDEDNNVLMKSLDSSELSSEIDADKKVKNATTQNDNKSNNPIILDRKVWTAILQGITNIILIIYTIKIDKPNFENENRDISSSNYEECNSKFFIGSSNYDECNSKFFDCSKMDGSKADTNSKFDTSFEKDKKGLINFENLIKEEECEDKSEQETKPAKKGKIYLN